MPFAEAQMHAAGKVIDRQRIKTAIPKFAEQFIRDIWILQPKLAAPRSKQIVQLSEHPRFRAGFDFLLLREQCGDAEHPLSESTNGMGEWWQTYQTLSEREQQQAIEAFDENIRRGAYKKGQRSRGRNRQKPEANITDHSPSNQNSAKQSKANTSTDKGRNDQTMVNDPSNIPARRRRAVSQSKNDSSNNTAYNTQQVKQDSNELAQLQQLSLASNNQATNKRHHSKPAPLFVIEHEKVVPPLQKQLPAESASQPKRKNTPVQTDKADRSDSTQLSKANSSEVKASSDQVKPTRTIARSPALVSMNNEPIPHKRRRRQPTVDSTNSVELQSKNDKEQSTAKYARKAPKSVATSASPADTTEAKTVAREGTKKAATPTKAKKPVKAKTEQVDSNQAPAVKVTDDKGPVPSKRRRRQPSTESA